MRRRDFLAFTVGAAATWPLAARAQQPTTKNPRVGWLVSGSSTSHRFSLAAFQDGLKALGYVEGQNIRIEYRWAEGDLSRLPKLANDLVQQKVDVIMVGGTPVAEAMKHATSDIPIVAAGVGDLAEIGLVASLARPGGNLTGFVVNAPETAAKRLELTRDIKPQARRATIVGNLGSSIAKLELGFVKDFATANEFVLTVHDVRELEGLKSVLTEVPRSDPDFFLVLNDPFVFTYRKTIVDAANRYQLPSIFGLREFVDDGGLMSYGASITDTYRRAAGYVDQILRGASPANLPVQLPTKFELVINLKTAKALGLTMNRDFLLRADEAIE
jgi:putative ABC transport system substrate-binding protein